MLIRAIDRADVTIRRMAFQADLLLRSRFVRNVNGTVEVAEHGVVKLLYTVELGLEVGRCAGSDMAFDTGHLRMRGMLSRDKLRLHRHMTTLTAKIDRLSILISFITAESCEKEKSNSAEGKHRQDSPVTFPGQIDLENTMFFFQMRCATLSTFVQDCAQKREREAEKRKKNGAMTYARMPMYGFLMGANRSIAKSRTNANSAAAASTTPAQLSQFWK